MDSPTQLAQAQLILLDGGGNSISQTEPRHLRRLARSLSSLSESESALLCELVEALVADEYLQRARHIDVAPLSVMAEVISGWDPDGVYEFARAWVSTLVAREDGFQWEKCDASEKALHYNRIDAELARRGIRHPGQDLSG